jgi:O-acetylhomoserine (thiol)-lyase
MTAQYGNGTLCIQAGYTPKVGEPRILPIIQSTTYKYDDIEQVNRVMTLQEFGFKYTRTGNPTVAGFESKLNALEGGVGAIATASGQAANLLAITNICRQGDHIVSASTLYGGTFSLFHTTLPKFGITTSFFDPEAPTTEIAKLFRPNTKAIFGETIGNPGLNILDFAKLANVITHSASKYIDGHATSIGGAVVDGGNYNWANGKFPEFTEPDVSYNGVVYTKKFPQAPYLYKARAQFLRDFGGCLSPLNAFLFNLGLETLHLRMPRHSENALALAKFLKKHPQVNWVNYPGLDPVGKRRIAKYFSQPLGSGILTFGLKGDRKAIGRFAKNLKVAALVVHIGDARTSVLHPASSTHAQLNEEQLRAAGITPDLIRVSVGIEDVQDLTADFAQALAASK